MKSVVFCAVLVVSAGLYCLSNAGTESEIQPGQSVSSPDGRFTAELTDDREGNVHIKSNTTGKLYTVGALRPLYSLKWTGDSQTLVTIEHLAGGSQAALIHFDGDKWSRFEVDPTGSPPPYHHYAVIRQEIGWDKVKFTYKITDEQGNGMVIKFYLCSFDVDPRARSITNMHTREISSDVYWTLRYRSG
jgi:hypothetical protein